ncbi:MAG: hypothetical protein ACYTF1_00770 [Planctomycetota bacterium]
MGKQTCHGEVRRGGRSRKLARGSTTHYPDRQGGPKPTGLHPPWNLILEIPPSPRYGSPTCSEVTRATDQGKIAYSRTLN